MNCHAPIPSGHPPFDDDDSFLPNYRSGAARLIDCRDCGFEHRADYGCVVDMREGKFDSANVLVWCVVGVIWCVCGALIVRAVLG